MSFGSDEGGAAGGQKRADPFSQVRPALPGSGSIDPGRTWTPDPAGGLPSVSVKPGQVLLGQYLVKRKLGAGGMGSVWLVEDQVLKTDRALKLIASGFADLPEALARFQREAQVMARVKHDHAVVVHTAQVVGDMAAIVMEFISGDSIDHLLKSGRPMPLEWVARVLEQICAVLEVAHDQGIVHRDLKPSNLMLVSGRPPGEVFLKVLDFGLAKILSTDSNEAITRSKGGLGTVPYLSPEQALGNEVGIRSDIYSVGVILYEFLTGHRPFQGPMLQVIYDHVHTAPPPFQDKAPGCRVPADVERVVMQCLEKDPTQRPASARALADAFLRAAGYAIKPPTPKAARYTHILDAFLKGKPSAVAVAGLVLVAVVGALSVGLAVRSVVGVPLTGTVRLEFDAPVDGLVVKLNGSSVVGSGPFTVPTGSCQIVVTQGDFTAADPKFTVTAGENAPFRIGLRRRAVVRVQPPSATVSVDGSGPRQGREPGVGLRGHAVS
jgi:hypothetical protein